MGVPSVGLVVGDVEDGELVGCDGSEADGVVVVVGFDVDDGAFVGGVGDGFGVCFEASRMIHFLASQCSFSVIFPWRNFTPRLVWSSK